MPTSSAVFQVHAHEQPHPGREDRHRDGEMQQRAPDHLRLRDLPEVQLQPHGEEQHQHAQMRNVMEDLARLLGQAQPGPEDVDCEPGGEKAHERRQPHLPHREAEEEGEGDRDNLEHAALRLGCEAHETTEEHMGQARRIRKALQILNSHYSFVTLGLRGEQVCAISDHAVG